MLETSWALIRLCKEIIKESKGDWIEMEEKNNMEKKKEEEKTEKEERIKKGKKKKELILEKETQRKINVMFQELNDRNRSEWEKIINKEKDDKRKEVKEIKQNLWRWRKNTEKKEDDKIEKIKELTTEEKYTRILQIYEKEKKESEKLRRERIKRKSEKEDGWKTVREERKLEREQKMKENIRKEEAWTNIRNTIKFLEEKVPEWKEEDLDDDLLRHESLEKDKFIRRRLKKRLKYKFLKKDQFKRELEKVN